jgi:general secretion pathway protein K
MIATGRHPGPVTRLQHGIALVMVLWLLVLMTVIASSHSKNIRTETRLAFNQVETAKARNIAEAGLNHAILEMLVADLAWRWKTDGTIYPVEFDQGTAHIAVRDVRGLIDINRAGAPLFDAVLAAAGMENRAQRKALVDAILDWRDPDKLKHLNGAEDDDYQRAGLQWAARDGAFTSIEEFRYILGMTNELFARIAPYLTIHSKQAGVNAAFAPPWLAEILDANRNLASAAAGAVTGGTATYRISVRATTSSSTTATLEAVVQVGASAQDPYRILAWRTPGWSSDANAG